MPVVATCDLCKDPITAGPIACSECAVENARDHARKQFERADRAEAEVERLMGVIRLDIEFRLQELLEILDERLRTNDAQAERDAAALREARPAIIAAAKADLDESLRDLGTTSASPSKEKP